MAKASRDAKWKACSEDLPDFGLPIQQNPLHYYLLIGNLSHIKDTEIWKKPDVYKNSYFILPSTAEYSQLQECASNSLFQLQFSAMVLEDFVKFWHELSDDHKERRLMLNYLCAIRGIEEMYDKLGIFGRGDMKVLLEMVSEYTSIFRQLWIKGQHLDDLKKLQDIMAIFNNMLKGLHVREMKMFSYFSTPFDAAVSILKKKCKCSDRSANDIVHKITDRYFPAVVDGLINLYKDWDSFEMVKKEVQRLGNMEWAVKISAAKSGKLSNPNEGDRKRFVSKVNAQVPHWNTIDRAKILGMIENPGDGPMDFMRKLMEEVGMEKFKILAFGKEYFCASCNRSSYIGDDRLWACPRCHWEGTRPMARYCDENCQKADWIKHELEFHSVDVCNKCKKKAEPGKKLGRCGRCLKENVPNPAVYCDEVCQKQDWAKHKVAKHTKKDA